MTDVSLWNRNPYDHAREPNAVLDRIRRYVYHDVGDITVGITGYWPFPPEELQRMFAILNKPYRTTDTLGRHVIVLDDALVCQRYQHTDTWIRTAVNWREEDVSHEWQEA